MPRRADITKPGGQLRLSSSPCSSFEEETATPSCVGELAGALARSSAVVISCPATLEGVLAAVGATYLAHADPALVRLERAEFCQPRIGEEVVSINVGDDLLVDLAQRVYLGFEARAARGCGRTRSGTCSSSCVQACARRLVFACANDAPDMPEVVHRYLRLGFALGAKVRDMLSHPTVTAFDALARHVSNECEHTRQFVRFSQMDDGSFFASFRPNANTIPLTSGYFAARMQKERFCLADPIHAVAAFHEPGKRGCVISQLDSPLMELFLERGRATGDDERYVREMWRTFYASVALDGRDASQRGYDLRASWMPKRFWGGLTELDQHEQSASTHVPERYQDAFAATPPRG